MSYKPEIDLNHNVVSPHHRYGCYDKPQSRETAIEVQHGWTTGGRRATHMHQTRWLDIGCGHSYRETDPSCRGCKWRDA